MNRIGDLGIGLAICLIYLEYKSLDFSIIFPLIDHFKYDSLLFLNSYYSISLLIVLFIVIGAIGKSAQFGLHT
jgi:NADH:ubiquinone oxidoreductase subunit 5 (subunit L)/multisubunit Na+/H+ antiporter MnhA subunit